MLCFMHEAEERGKLPWTNEEIAQAVGGNMDDTLKGILELTLKGVVNPLPEVGLECRRMVRDERKRKLCAEAGKRGGNPNLVPTLKGDPKGETTPTVKPNQTPSSSSSSSSSEDLSPTPQGQGVNAKAQAAEKQKAIAEIYAAYPKKVGKPAAMKAIAKALLAVDSPTLLQKTSDFATAVAAWPVEDRRFVPHPATWFNQERYNDDPAEWTRSQPANFTASRNGASPKAETPRRIYTQHPEPACDWREHPAVVALYDGGFGRDVQWDTLPMEGQIEIIEAIARKKTTP